MFERIIKLSDNKKIKFITEDDNECGKELIESFNKAVPFFPKNDINNLENITFWKSTLENDIQNKDCTYILDNIWKNIVTQIEQEILKSRGYPTNILDIIKYMCDEIVKGRVDDWNSLDNLRIRTGEIFISQLQKQILAAYSEYKAKFLAGDLLTKYYINSTKVFSQILTSENVQTLENINPIEELSAMTKLSPIGIGGVTDSREFPMSAQNIHYTYFGNIDPLDGPDSDKIGIQQYLTMGSSITNVRGLFTQKPRVSIKPSEILSVAPSMIPFISNNDGIRVIMSSAQQKQAIPLKDPEIPAVQTGYESVMTPLLSEYFIKKSPANGVVKNIEQNLIIIEDENKQEVGIDIKPLPVKSGQGLDGLSVFKPTIKIGDKVKQNDVIAEGANIKNGIISNGVNLLVAFMPWMGYNFDDGMVMGESATKKFNSLSQEIHQVYLKDGEDIAKIVNIGDVIKKGEILLSYSSTIYDTETLNNVRGNGGTVVDIEVYSNLPEDNIPEALLPAYNKFSKKYILLNKKYPIGTFKERNKPFEGILVKFYIQNESSMKIGDKINCRHFNKGVLSCIIPEDKNPKTPWGQPLDLVYSVLSIVNRMNPGQLYELPCGLIAKTLGGIICNKPRTTFETIFSKVLTTLDATEKKQMSSNTISKLKAMNDLQYKKMIEQIKNNQEIFPLIFPPFKTPKYDAVLKALNILGLKDRYPIYIPEYGKWTTPVAVGYMYVMALEHQVEKKITTRSTGRYSAKMFTPSKGGKDDRPALVGEYDTYTLLAWDAATVLDELLGPMSADQKTKSQLISNIIQNGKTSFIPPQTNPVRDVFRQFMLAMHLQSS